MGRKIKYVVRLIPSERKMLFELIEKGRANKGKLNRARILLKADCGEAGENWDDHKIAEALYVSEKTVFSTRKSLVEEGLTKTLDRIPQKKRNPPVKLNLHSYKTNNLFVLYHVLKIPISFIMLLYDPFLITYKKTRHCQK